ncbi:MAG: glycoside hydrolase family 2, partial [Verrucomicrobia bacterium]|nr:glycoside hydrolase family 2 [Verrucomicrobiota bacterium]
MALTLSATAGQKPTLPPGLSPLFDKFQQPPPDTRPGCYWYWINDNISKAGITKDLEAMARVGIGRAYIGHIFGQGDRWETPVGNVPFMSDAWWDAVQWAVKEADRCGVEIGFFNSPGWSQSGGPWIKPAQSMRYLAASETVIEGGRRVAQVLPVPEIKTFPNSGGSKPKPTGDRFTEKDFQDVRAIAFRQPETEAADLDMRQVKVSSATLKPLEALLDGDAKTEVKIGPKAAQLNFELDGAVPVQSLCLNPGESSYTLTCVVAVSADGLTFRELTRHVEQRGHQGPRTTDPVLIPFPETRAKHLRVTLSASKPTAFSGLALSRRAVLANHVRKQLGETSPSVRPPWDTYIWSGQPAPLAGSAVDSATVVDLSDKMDANGRLTWDAPPGRWLVLRSGMIPIGTQCAPASPQSRGLEVDKMSKEHIRSLFDGMVGEFLRRTPPAERKALKYVIADSYETGPQNWTDGFVEKFQQRFGYSPVRFLPAFTGRVVDTPEISSRLLWDWRRLVVESIAYDYVGGLREVAAKNHLTLWLENYGHWGFPSEFLLYGSQSDQVGGEFWENDNSIGNVECRAAASCSHIYGRS